MLTFTGASDDLLSISDNNGGDELCSTDGRFVVLVREPDGIEHGALWLEFEYGPRNERGDGVWSVQLYPYSEDVKIPWRIQISSEGYRTSVHIMDTQDAVWEDRTSGGQ